MIAKRAQNGGMLPVVLICVAVLVMILVGAFTLSLIFSGEQKVRSVVDAGALMVAQNAPNLKVRPPELYADCADTEGKIGLMNINRVIGKAMLIAMNAQDMKNSGQPGSSGGSASQALSDAESVEDQVRNKVMDTSECSLAFRQAVPNSGTASSDGNAGGTAPPKFDSSFVHRDDESNLKIDKGQLPDSIELPKGSVVEEGEAAGCLRGYKGITANGKDFYFVPFRAKELPHLIPVEEFRDNKKDKKPLGWGSAVPNAFKVTADGGVTNMVSMAAAVANPQQTYRAAIPHAYVSIKVHPTEVTWKVNAKQAGKTQYYFEKQQQQGFKKYMEKCALLDGFGDLGNEYTAKDLASVMKAVPSADHDKMFKLIEQRLKEIQPDFSGVEKLLSSQQVDDNELEFLLFPIYNEKDNTDPRIIINAKSAAAAGWLNKSVTPDGEQKQIGKEELTDGKNHAWVVPTGIWMLSNVKIRVSGQILWKPGTGANQHLGEMEIIRKCEVTYEGKCP